MRLLGVDTSSSHASVAIVENGRLVSEKLHSRETLVSSVAAHSRNNHAQILLPLIESALGMAALSLNDISALAVAIGPGSFTGLRIGLSTVKGLAYGCDTPVTGISTLHASAARVSNFNGVVCAMLDARKKEVYTAMFRRLGGSLERLSDDRVMVFEKLADCLSTYGSSEPVMLTGAGVVSYGERLSKLLGAKIHISQDEKLPTIAAAVALLGEAHFTTEGGESSVSLTPRYLREPEAQVNAGKLA